MKLLCSCSTTADRAEDGRLASDASGTSLSEKSATRRRRATASELWTSELLPTRNGGVRPLELGRESALVGYQAPGKPAPGQESVLSAALQRKGGRSRRVRQRSLLPSAWVSVTLAAVSLHSTYSYRNILLGLEHSIHLRSYLGVVHVL